MPTPTPFPPSHPPSFPALYLYPLNDSFIPKNISLLGNQRVKIGRQTNAKTVPGERNGYFDSKVLSRQHAEVWEESGKIFIKDVKSSNGTFINGDRLSPEGVESDPYELKTDDIVEFGIDIVGEDNKTIIHHKVAARVTCIFNADDALAASREAYNFQHQGHQQNGGPAGTLNAAAQRRPALQPQANGIGGMGGMGGGMRQPGKGALTFEHILNRLQGELQRSRETSVELNAVGSAMKEIGEVIDGGQPANLPPYPHVLPPVRPPSQHPQQQQQPSEHDSSPAALQSLQSQLAETQQTLSTQVEKIRTLESLLSEHDGIRREVNALRELIDERERQRIRMSEPIRDDDDDDDARSIHTVVPHELETVPEEDEGDVEESEEERHARRVELGRPRTPEPSSLGMQEDDEEQEHERLKEVHADMMHVSTQSAVTDEMARRLTSLSEQLESALDLSRNLQAQHAAAQRSIQLLEGKVSTLEELVRATQAAKAADEARLAEEAAQREKERETNMSAMFAEFKKTFEDRWESYKHEWDVERERMDKARGEWESRVKVIEDGVSHSSGKFELGLTSLASQLANLQSNGHLIRVKDANGLRKGGLVTPPSPRSLSANSDSDSDGHLRASGRKRSGSRNRRGRTKTKSRSPAMSTSATLVDSESSVKGAGSVIGSGSASSGGSMHSRSSSGSPSLAPVSTDNESIAASPDTGMFPSQYPPTPASSLVLQPKDTVVTPPTTAQAVNNAQVAVGVFVLGVAAGAVLWRIKEGAN